MGRFRSVSEPTQPSSCSGCPLYGIAKGFVLGCGSPEKARYAIMLEAPGRDEVSFELKPNPNRAFLKTREECEKELEIRKRDYPELENGHLRVGLPVVGQTGLALQFWIWPKVGIRREECFIDNTIRCLPPKSKSGIQYPTGDTKKAAEQHCRRYDRIMAFRPDTLVFGLHPAGLLREITPLPLAIKDFEKVRDFTSQGRRVLALLGGKATSAFARYGANVTRWRGHYQALAADWSERYKELFTFTKKGRKKRVKEDNFFGVPEKIVAKAKERTTRPEGVMMMTCRGCKRYQGKKPPTKACATCWDKYESLNKEIK
jgi:uracil-DNA glycosylase